MKRTASYLSLLLAWSVGVSCIVLPASAQSSNNLSSDEITAAFASTNNKSKLQHVSASCEAPATPTEIENDFARSLLTAAEREIEKLDDIEQKGTAFYEVGKAYACIGRTIKAGASLQRARSYIPHLNEYQQVARQIEIANVYGELLNDAEIARELLAIAKEQIGSMNPYISKYELFKVAEIYSKIEDIEQMNAVLAQATPLIEVRPDDTHGRWYPELTQAGLLYAQHRQYLELRALIDSIENPYVQIEILSAVAVPLAKVDSAAERLEIVQLFSDFEIEAFLSEASLNSLTETADIAPENRQKHPYHAYREQLNSYSDDGKAEGLADASTEDVALLIKQQSDIIEQIDSPLVQAVAYSHFGEYLSYFGQPRAAIPIFEASQQLFTRNADRQFPVAPSDLRTVTEESHSLRVQGYISKALIRAGEFEQGIQMLKSFEKEGKLATDRLIYSLTHIARFTESSTFSLPHAVHVTSLAKAEALVSNLTDKEARFEALTDIANIYAAIGDIDDAKRLASSVEESFTAVITAMSPDRHSSIPQDYAEFLIAIGDYEAAIALADTQAESSDYVRELPAQFVAAGEDERAAEIRAGLATSGDRLSAGRHMVIDYQSQGQLDKALTLTRQLLEEAQSVDLLAAEQRADIPGLYRTSTRYQMGIEEERIERTGYIVSLYLNGWSHIDRDVLSAELVDAIGFDLIASIDQGWLRSAVIENQLTTEDAISAFDRDAELIAPDSVLLEWSQHLAERGDFQAAVSNAEQIQSPYAKARILAAIAASYTDYTEN